MNNPFPELKSQEDIDDESLFNWFKWYFIISTVVSMTLCLLFIAALVKYVFL